MFAERRLRKFNTSMESLGLAGIVARLKVNPDADGREFGQGWFSVPKQLEEVTSMMRAKAKEVSMRMHEGEVGKDKVKEAKAEEEEEGEEKGWQKYLAKKGDFSPRGLGGFVDLFRKAGPEAKKLGPVWHMWQFMLAMIPTAVMYVVVSFIKGRDLTNQPAFAMSADERARFARFRKEEIERECKEKGVATQQELKAKEEAKMAPWWKRIL